MGTNNTNWPFKIVVYPKKKGEWSRYPMLLGKGRTIKEAIKMFKTYIQLYEFMKLEGYNMLLIHTNQLNGIVTKIYRKGKGKNVVYLPEKHLRTPKADNEEH